MPLLEPVFGCLFAAYVTSHAAFGTLNSVRVPITSPYEVSALIEEGVLILMRNNTRVEIQHPRDQAWHRIKYWWGSRVAEIEVWT